MADKKIHKGIENLKPWKPGQSGNPKGKVKGTLTHKNRFKKDIMVMKWIQDDPELALMVESLDNIEMFDALKNSAFAMYASDPSNMTKYDRAFKAVSEEREYSEGKKVRQEVNQTVTNVTDMTIEELEAELADIDSIDDAELDLTTNNSQEEGSPSEKPKT